MATVGVVDVKYSEATVGNSEDMDTLKGGPKMGQLTTVPVWILEIKEI